jgi:hypothetical protein
MKDWQTPDCHFKVLSQHFTQQREKRNEPSRVQNYDFRSGTYDYHLQGIGKEETLTISRHNPHMRVQLLKKTTKPPSMVSGDMLCTLLRSVER